MHIIRDLNDLAAIPTLGCAFVPTMGALHTGHLALIRKAAEVAKPGTPVVVSIFVNPTQFGPGEDFTRYPRMFDADVKAAESAGAQIIFAPEVETMYPPGQSIAIPKLPLVATEPKLEDAFRPTHFAGVCQVVARLFDHIKPAAAIFGEKDYQQLQVIRAMVQQEGQRWPGLSIVPLPTVREADGLAMSSRNLFIKTEDRDRALELSRALTVARKFAAVMSPIETIEELMHASLRIHHLKVDYAVVREPTTLMPIRNPGSPARALIAARLGRVRLIDNAAIP